MLVLLTIVCAWLGFKVQQVKQQREAVAWVLEHGGSVFYDYQYEHHFSGDAEPNYIDVPPPAPKWLREWIGIDYLAKVQVVLLCDLDSEVPPITSLEPLANLGQLKHLILFSDYVSDLSPVAKLSQLERLELSAQQIHDLSPLLAMSELKTLDLNDTPISDAQIAEAQRALPECEVFR
jgi:hypothetical protein